MWAWAWTKEGKEGRFLVPAMLDMVVVWILGDGWGCLVIWGVSGRRRVGFLGSGSWWHWFWWWLGCVGCDNWVVLDVGGSGGM